MEINTNKLLLPILFQYEVYIAEAYIIQLMQTAFYIRFIIIPIDYRQAPIRVQPKVSSCKHLHLTEPDSKSLPIGQR